MIYVNELDTDVRHIDFEGISFTIKDQGHIYLNRVSILNQQEVAEIPKEFKNKEVEAAVKKLATDAQALHTMIQKKASDDEVKKALAALHDTFHLIVEKCQPGDHHHHDHEGHEGHGH